MKLPKRIVQKQEETQVLIANHFTNIFLKQLYDVIVTQLPVSLYSKMTNHFFEILFVIACYYYGSTEYVYILF